MKILRVLCLFGLLALFVLGATLAQASVGHWRNRPSEHKRESRVAVHRASIMDAVEGSVLSTLQEPTPSTVETIYDPFQDTRVHIGSIEAENVEFVGYIGGTMEAVFVVGDYAYVGEGECVTILDVASPVMSTLVGKTLPLPEKVADIYVSVNYAYVAAGDAGLRVVDVSDPTAPVAVGSYAMPGEAWGVVIVGSTAYVAAGNAGLRVVDVSDPTAPVEIGFYPTPGYAYDVAVAADYAYVAAGDAGLRVINVRDPTAPAEVSFYDTPGVAQGVMVTLDHAYVADGKTGLRVIDIRNPLSPMEVDAYDTSGNAWGVAVVGSMAYVADGDAGLRVVDVTTPTALLEVGFYDTPGDARDVTVMGGIAYLADKGRGLRRVNVSNPMNPIEIDCYAIPEGGRDVAVAGNLVYLVGQERGLRVMDVSTPTIPVEIGSYTTPGNGQGIALADSMAYIADYGYGLRVVDVSEPAAPVEVGFHDTPGNAQDVAVDRHIVYVADYGYGLRVIDVSTPTAPAEVGFHNTPGSAQDVAVAGSIVYVADGDVGLRVVDVSTPTEPLEVGFYNTPGDAQGIAVAGSIVYIADWDAGLRIVDVSSPTAPVEIGFYDTPGCASDVVASNNMAYVVDWHRGLRVVDVSSPTAPVEVAFYDANALYAFSAAVVGSTIYVVDWDGGFFVLRYTGPSAPVLSSIPNLDGDGTYTVTWSEVSGATAYTLEEANNADFTNPCTYYVGNTSHFTISGQVGGTWYYRVRASNFAGDSAWSNLVSAAVRTLAPTLTLIANADGDGDYTVAWSDVPGAISYTLQEAANVAFTNPVTLYRGSASEYAIAGQCGGTWYYRACASNPAGHSAWSNLVSTTVRPLTPTLNPVNNADGDGDYTVAWSDVPGAISYTLQESANVAFTNPVTLYRGTVSEHAIVGQGGGTWYYRARASNLAGHSAWSDLVSSMVRPAAPAIYMIANADGDGDYTVDWSDVTGVVSYTLQEADNVAFTGPLTSYVSSDSKHAVEDHPRGTWSYRVKASNAAGASDWSNSVSVDVKPDTPFLYNIVNSSADAAYSVDWSDVPGAASYVLQEDDNPDFTSPITCYTGSSSQYGVNGQVVGIWYYRVQARVPNDPPSDWSNIAATTVVNGAIVVPSTWVLEGQTVFFLAEIQAEEASLALYTVTLHLGSQVLPLYDDGMGSDFYPEDGLYSAYAVITQTGSLTATLRLGPRILGQQYLDVITASELLLLTDWDALYAEFRDTEMPVHIDENGNGAHDFFDLVARLQQYTRAYYGVVVDLPKAIKRSAGYPRDYANLDYGAGTNTRLQMGHLVDQLIANLNVRTDDSFQHVVLLGDDQVVPFYRVYDPTDFYSEFNQDYPYEYRSREIGYPGEVDGAQENATLLDSQAAYIMSDVPYGIRTHQVITRGTWNSMYPELPRWATYPEPEMGVGRIFAAYPHELIQALERYETPLHMTPGTARAALFRALDKTGAGETAVDFSALAERSLFPELRDWFGGHLQDYDQATWCWGADAFITALGHYDLVSWWGHSTHQIFHISQEGVIDWQDRQRLKITQPLAFVGFGCHLGYSVGRHPDGGGPVYPYMRSIANPLVAQGVTYFAPSSYAYTWPKTLRSSNLHELVIAQFINRLMDYTAPTVGDVWQKGFHPYHATDPAVVENNNPATRLFHIAAAYGNILYGLPTQPIERIQPRGVLVSHQRATVQGQRQRVRSIMPPTLTVTIPHFTARMLDDGTTLFSVPNDGTHLAPTNGPVLPLVIRILTLSDNVQVKDVRLVSVQSEPYPQPVTLARPQFETSNGQLITGTYVLPGAYPENLFHTRIVQTDEGQQLILSAIPLQYDTQSHQVTLYTQMDFHVTYEISSPVPGPKLTRMTVNANQPLHVNVAKQPLHIEVTHDQDVNVNLMWTVLGLDGFVVTSGNMVLHVVDGTTTVNIPLDTTGWRPGPKDLTVYVVHEGYISDSENISLVVAGLGVEDLDPQHHVYTVEDAAVTWHIAVRDERGALVPDLVDTIKIWIDGQSIDDAEVQAGNTGEYYVQVSLNAISTGPHLVRVSATDVRGLNGWREWLMIKEAQIYLPLILKQQLSPI